MVLNLVGYPKYQDWLPLTNQHTESKIESSGYAHQEALALGIYEAGRHRSKNSRNVSKPGDKPERPKDPPAAEEIQAARMITQGRQVS